MGDVSLASFVGVLLVSLGLATAGRTSSTWERTPPALVRGVTVGGRLVLKVLVGLPPNQRRTCVDLASSVMTLGCETRAFSASRDSSSEVYGLSSSGPFVRLRTVIDPTIADGQPCEAVLGLGPLSDVWSWWSSATFSRRSLTMRGDAGHTSPPLGYVTDGVGSNCSGVFRLDGHIADGEWKRVRLFSGGLRGAAVDRGRYSTYLRTGIDPTSCWDGATSDLKIALDECRRNFAVVPHDSDEATLDVGTAALAACSVALCRDQIALSCCSADPPAPLAAAARALACLAIASTVPVWFGLGSPRTIVLCVGALSVLSLGAATWSAACGTLLLDCQSVWVLVGLGWCALRLVAQGILNRRVRAGSLQNVPLETAVVLSIWTCMRMGSGVDFSGSLADATLVMALVFRLFIAKRGDLPLDVLEVLLLRFHSFVLSALWSWGIFLDLYVDASHVLSRLAATLLTASVAITATAAARSLRRTVRITSPMAFQ